MSAERSASLLSFLVEGGEMCMSGRHTAVVLAHPGDETISCGAALARLDGATFVLVTDGAPRDERDANRRGFVDWDGYAAARWRELGTALAIAGIAVEDTFALAIPDRQAALQLVRTTRALLHIFRERRISVVITHAYEGGHPDHDAAAFAVHAAAELLGRTGHPLSIIEAPLYHQGASGIVRQRFAGTSDTPETIVALLPSQCQLKLRMAAAHATQRDVIAEFSLACERFRPAPAYDFSRLPNAGAIFHERCEWGIHSAMWSRLAQAAQRELGLMVRMC